MAERVFCPAPAEGVLDLEFDGHTRLTADIVQTLVVVVFRADVAIWVEGFGVDFDVIGHADDPVLLMK